MTAKSVTTRDVAFGAMEPLDFGGGAIRTQVDELAHPAGLVPGSGVNVPRAVRFKARTFAAKENGQSGKLTGRGTLLGPAGTRTWKLVRVGETVPDLDFETCFPT